MASLVDRSRLNVFLVFASIGLATGVGALMVMGSMGAFDADDLGAAFAAVFVVIAVVAFVALIGPVVAAIIGQHLAQTIPDRTRAAKEGALLGGLGHAAMVLVLLATLFIGFSIFGPDSNTTGSTADADDDPVDYGQILKLLWAMLPAAIVGGVTAWALWAPREVRAPHEAPIDAHA